MVVPHTRHHSNVVQYKQSKKYLRSVRLRGWKSIADCATGFTLRPRPVEKPKCIPINHHITCIPGLVSNSTRNQLPILYQFRRTFNKLVFITIRTFKMIKYTDIIREQFLLRITSNNSDNSFFLSKLSATELNVGSLPHNISRGRGHTPSGTVAKTTYS